MLCLFPDVQYVCSSDTTGIGIQLQVVERNGMKTIGMVYENKRIIDFFYYVNENMVAGVMDNRELGRFPKYHFYLYR